MATSEKIRNVAIIAHIDHGKTTLLDSMLKQSNIFREGQVVRERVMDSNDQEQERGITIFAKHTSIHYDDFKINIIDTPGHADFSGEVERVLGMVNSVILIVDAKEGPMPQTRYVLSKSLKMGLCPIVVLNKIDRPHADPEKVLNETFDLFVELGANDKQLDFAYILASGLSGYAVHTMTEERVNLDPLFDLIVQRTPAPSGKITEPFLMQAATIVFDDYLGRQACGRILQGSVKKGQEIYHINGNKEKKRVQVTKVQGHLGLEKIEMEEASVGDIVLVAGAADVTIGDTLCAGNNTVELPPISLDEPTVSINVVVNNGPFAGKDGKHVTMNKIRARLERERKANVSYHIEEGADDRSLTIAGRGELHLAVLLESMRREDFEFCVSKPRVILKEIDGVRHEPFDRVNVDVPEEYSGVVIEQLSRRKGEMQHLHTNEQGITSLEFLIPTRGLMGYRNEFLTSTRGLGILTSTFESYGPWKGEIVDRVLGSLISINIGKASGYACFNLEDRGTLFVGAGDEVYEGMVVGEHSRDNDLIVNITKGKQLTNVRAAGNDENILLTPPRTFNLEQAISYIKNDELIEVTPKALRIRKKFLTENERKRGVKG